MFLLRKITITVDISIHALLAESDNSLLTNVVSSDDFYPRSPCGERRGGLLSCFVKIIFLSTLSLRRATILHMAHLMEHLFLSTLSLRRATPEEVESYEEQTISIHALLAESDACFGWL